MVRLRAFAGGNEVGGARFLVQNLAPDVAALVGPDGLPAAAVETTEPIVGLVPAQPTGGRAVVRVVVVNGAASPVEAAIQIPPPPAGG